jgi:hypothetical protein
MNLVDELHAIASVLRSAGIRHAVCGGLAVTLHGAALAGAGRRLEELRALYEPAKVLQAARKV